MRYSHFLVLAGLLLTGCISKQQKPSTIPSISQDSVPAVTQRPTAEYNRAKESLGQMIYVPVYSHIYQKNRQRTFNLTSTLSIRNTDPYRSLKLTEVSYYDSKGDLVKQFLDSTFIITPLASTSYVIEELDLRGGVGANFIVNWRSEQPVNPPVIEAVMISTSQQQGISFLSKGRLLQERQPEQKSEN